MRVLLTLLLSTSVFFSFVQDWLPVGTGLRSGNNKDINALVSFNGSIIAGGAFENLFSNDTLIYIARWDGNAWKQMGIGGGFDNYVNCLTVFNGELHAGGEMFGRFNDDGTEFIGGFAKWNGSKWIPVSGLTDGSVYAMTEFDGKLVLARRENIIDPNLGTTISSDLVLTTFDGNNFNNIPGIFKGPENYAILKDMCLYNNQLVVVGRFDSVDNIPARMVAAWNGTNWNSLDFPVQDRTTISQGIIGIEGYANACTVYDNKLYVGGLFSTFNFPNTATPTSLASYDNSSWTRHQFDENIGNTINDLVIKNDTMFVLGEYAISVLGNILYGVTIFNESLVPPFENTNFYPVIQAPGSGVNTGLVFNNELYVGGDFQRAGSNEVNNIARYNPNATIVSVNSIRDSNGTDIFPNPITLGNKVKVITNTKSSYSLVDLNGKTILSGNFLNGENVINTENLQQGLYLLKEGNKTHRIVLY